MAFVDALWAPSSLLLPAPAPGRATLTSGAAKSAPARPLAHIGYVNRQHRNVGRLGRVLRVLRHQKLEGALSLLALVEQAGAPAEADPPEAAQVFLVVIDEDRDVRTGSRVLNPLERP